MSSKLPNTAFLILTYVKFSYRFSSLLIVSLCDFLLVISSCGAKYPCFFLKLLGSLYLQRKGGTPWTPVFLILIKLCSFLCFSSIPLLEYWLVRETSIWNFSSLVSFQTHRPCAISHDTTFPKTSKRIKILKNV